MATKKLNPIHPGEVLREECIRPMGMSQRGCAGSISATHTRLNQIVNEKRSITSDTALRLSGPSLDPLRTESFQPSDKYILSIAIDYGIVLIK